MSMTPVPSSISNDMANHEAEVDEEAISYGKLTIERAIEGLSAMVPTLDREFAMLVERIIALKGRLIVSGMGKSGHIARKIAATFASTGTPSYYVHPAEANHGDMGMIAGDDLLLLLSNSGETAELAEMIAYAKRFEIPMAALVRRAGSMLSEVADMAIVLPEIPEVSGTGAPTTSTTMMLVYGDALAMAVLEKRGFTKDDFRNFHPGGKLGSALLRISDLMHQGEALPIVTEQIPMQEALVEITRKALGCAIVVTPDGALAGIITDGDLRRHMESGLLEQRAGDVMTTNPITLSPQALAAEALQVINSRAITGLIAADDEGRPIGFIHVHDCLRAGVA